MNIPNTPYRFPQPICEQIWNGKYRFITDRIDFHSDQSVQDTWFRIAKACAEAVPSSDRSETRTQFYNALSDFKFLPAGRIISGAGTGRNVTLFNCYVMGTIPDSLDGIFDMLKEAALTMQQGGGIGYDFSTLRPAGAPVKGVESFSSGPLTFMDVWDAMCKTIMSAGHRRGAMMATMRCDHPDIVNFIKAKQDPLRLRQFNVSVLCTDEFMEAVANKDLWDLTFEGVVYDQIQANELWEMILQNTYDFAEPGVIFIDRINKNNNLWFLETIAATNPCGEQPLPPYGACLLGSINLTKFIRNPFTSKAAVDFESMEVAVRTAVRMLDCVIDVSNFPLDAQRSEAYFKRRIGLGITGLADLFFMRGIKYGSGTSSYETSMIMELISNWAYRESLAMAKEWGCAPCFDTQEAKDQLIQSEYLQNFDADLVQEIGVHGLRNSHLISIAPTGTISMYAGNVTSGIEPVFAPSYDRKVTNADGTKRTERVHTYSVLLWNEMFSASNQDRCEELNQWWNQYMVTAQDLDPQHHITIQAAAQKWVDSSISKTVNCPEDISFDEFKDVYQKAYETGCKGCTTYRPNAVTGSVLSVIEEPTPEADPTPPVPDVQPDMRIMARPMAMQGLTYKLRWGTDAYYVTFNHALLEDGQSVPFEIFINTKNPEHHSWIAALTRMISAVFQRGGDISFVAEEMKSVFDPKGGQWVQGRYVPSLVALIGKTLEDHMKTLDEVESDDIILVESDTQSTNIPDQCPSCHQFSMLEVSGCPVCQECGYSKCG